MLLFKPMFKFKSIFKGDGESGEAFLDVIFLLASYLSAFSLLEEELPNSFLLSSEPWAERIRY